MKVRRFLATRVHGYLNLPVEIRPDLTFLTGINGSGKTTVVNGISALITPSLSYLAETKYERMEVEIEVADEIITIAAEKDGDLLSLKSSHDPEPLTIAILPQNDVLPPSRAYERDFDYYRDAEARHAGHPVMKRIRALPTPMFLGLERRSSSYFGFDAPTPPVARRRTHNPFASSLARSLTEAVALAELSYSGVQAGLRELTDDLKRKFILSALQYAPAERKRVRPPELDPQNIARVRATLRELGLADNEITKHLDPIVAKLKEISAYLPFDEDLNKVLSGPDHAKASAYLEWFTNASQFERLAKLLRHVDRYVAKSQSATRHIDAYLETVNQFLGDSKKGLLFDRTGNLVVSIRSQTPRPVSSLSSGEVQIVVILTHLAFNPAAQADNIFLIDEPELSLHLRWQELFVQAIRTLNPRLQTILATHSPAIILEEVDRCVDLSALQR